MITTSSIPADVVAALDAVRPKIEEHLRGEYEWRRANGLPCKPWRRAGFRVAPQPGLRDRWLRFYPVELRLRFQQGHPLTSTLPPVEIDVLCRSVDHARFLAYTLHAACPLYSARPWQLAAAAWRRRSALVGNQWSLIRIVGAISGPPPRDPAKAAAYIAAQRLLRRQ